MATPAKAPTRIWRFREGSFTNSRTPGHHALAGVAFFVRGAALGFATALGFAPAFGASASSASAATATVALDLAAVLGLEVAFIAGLSATTLVADAVLA